MPEHANIAPFLQEAVLHLVAQTCQVKDWGFEKGNNSGLGLDITAATNVYPEELDILSWEMSDQEGIKIQATIGPAITSWEAIQTAVYHLLSVVAEQFLVLTPIHDETALKFWFAIGSVTTSSPHGHFGTIMIPREAVQHLDPQAVRPPGEA